MESLSEKLSIFIGNWKVTGKDYSINSHETEITGEETYEWLPGMQLLVNNWCKNTGNFQRKGTGLMGTDASHHAFSVGNKPEEIYTRSYKMQFEDNKWTLSGEKERAIISFDENGSQFIQDWESTIDGQNWSPLWRLEGKKLNSV